MIHLCGLVFAGGVSRAIYNDSSIEEPDLIWPLISAMRDFTNSCLDQSVHGGFYEIKTGKYRFIIYDPFKYLTDESPYVYMALCDIYDNIWINVEKLEEIHHILLDMGLKTDDPKVELKFNFLMASDSSDDILRKVSKIVKRTQVFPENARTEVQLLIKKFINGKNRFNPLVVMVRDIDGGLVICEQSKDFVEDMSFTDLILSNVIAENPHEAKIVRIERKSPEWASVTTDREVFIMNQVGKNSDFRILCRVMFAKKYRESVRTSVRELEDKIYKVLKKYNAFKLASL